MTRLSFFRLILGTALGLIFGLYYAWDVSPRLINLASPGDLSVEFQNEYRALLSVAYANTNDLVRAKNRLRLLHDPDSQETLFSLSQEYLAAGRPQEEIRALALLASDLSHALLLAITPTIIMQGPASTRAPATPVPSPSPAPTENPTFELLALEKICDPARSVPLIQILALDSNAVQLPGVEFTVFWESGEDHFFTGLKPELGEGFADFEMEAELVYSVYAPGNSVPVSNLKVENCAVEAGTPFPGSWLLTFKGP
ncbi:MAG: hypothetical protein IIC78_01665 [Chloroflexi bacterium]|nr:hypothetical protein [Chloroflexota bacterium]